MSKPTSYRPPQITKDQIDALERKTGMSMSAVLTMAIDRMYRDEFPKETEEMGITIPAKFDPSVLPNWARKNRAVVAFAERNLAFRANVCQLKTIRGNEAMIRKLTQEAEQFSK